jgi:hypothetical protein
MPLLAFIAIAIGAFALSYVAAKQAQKAAKEAADSFRGVLVNKESNVEQIPVIYGTRRVGGTRVFVQAEGGEKNQFLYICLVLCEGEVEDIYDIKIDDFSIFDSKYGNVTRSVESGQRIIYRDTTDSDGAEAVYIEAYKGRPFQEASQILQVSSKWTSSHRLQGVAYLGIRLRWDEDVFSGMPEITAVVKGKKVYDPRNGQTQWSDNPALCLLDYMKDPVYGKGLPDSVLDMTAFSDAATYCEQTVVEAAVVPEENTGIFINNFNLYGQLWLDEVAQAQGPSTTQEQLFRCNMVLNTSNKLFENVNTMLLGMRGFLPYVNGKYTLRIDRSVEFTDDDLTLGPDDIIGGISIADVTKNERFNRVICKFPNPKAEWQPDEAIWPEPEGPESNLYLEQDGELLVDELDLETITSYYAARDFARILTLRSRNALRCNIKANSRAINSVAGDVINVVHPTPGWTTGKLFQIEQIGLNYDGTCDLSLLEYDPSVYSYEPDFLQPPIPDTDLPDPFDIDAPASLSLTAQGSYLPSGELVVNILADWPDSQSSYVTRYELAWIATDELTAFTASTSTTNVVTSISQYTVENLIKQTAIGEAQGARGPSLTFNLLLGIVQAVRGQKPYASGIKTGGIPYLFGVRAISAIGAKSGWTYASLGGNAGVDTTPPAPPSSISSVGGYKSANITWVNPTDIDLRHVEVWASTSSNVANAGLIAQLAAPTTYFFHGGLPNEQTYFYWLRSVDNAGNQSAYVSAGSATTQFIDVPDFTDSVTEIFDEAGLYAVPPYPKLTDAVAGTEIGQLAFIREDGKLYEWDGNSWNQLIPDVQDLIGELPDTVTIADDFITTPMLKADSVIADKILGGTITGDKIFANTITGGLLSASGIITDKLQVNAGVITEAAIEDLAVTGAKIKNLAVDTLKIKDFAVTVPTGASGAVSVDAGAGWQSLQSVQISWTGGFNYQPRGLIISGYAGFLGTNLAGTPAAADTVSVRFLIGFGAGGSSSAGAVGNSFPTGFGGSVATTGFVDMSVARASPVTITIQAKSSSSVRGVTNAGLSAIGAKR